MRWALAIAPLGACVWTDGEPMGTVRVELDARWVELAERDAGDGWQRLASDFELLVEEASAELGALSLVDTGATALSFDPADPPPGYSLCHGGHCHADDGRLVPYEEIAAELSGGAPPAPVLEVEVGARPLIPGGAEPLCDPGCDLPRAAIGRVEVEVARLEASGRVRDRRDPPRLDGEVAWTLTLERGDDAPAVLGRIDLPVDRAHDPDIALEVTLAPSAALFDEVRFELAEGEEWAIETDAGSVEAIEDALIELSLELDATRS